MKKRSESFFGLHFDFHSRGELPVGENLTYDVISELLDEVKPDYVQIDTKGHPGYSSYPTKIGNPAPDMRGDQVKMWRKLTSERNIALFGHHSGLFDMKASADHPEWAVFDENGDRSDYMSVFGDYPDKLLIPQLTELALDYKLDGAWVDGECWGAKVDYSDSARKEWAKISDTEPPKPGKDGFDKYLDFIRDGFRKYVKHYTEAIKAVAPEFQITSNWIYSSYMPEKPTVCVDFLSGDYAPKNSLNSARINGRYIANQCIPWDLMAWGHNSEGMWTTNNRSTKEFIQHAQEASYVMALGGGFQFYNIQYHEGSTVQKWAIPIWKKVADFVRAREPFCKGNKIVPQVGIFVPTEAHYKEINIPFSSGSNVIRSSNGLIHISQDCGYSSEILETHNLYRDDLNEFGTIMLGNAKAISDESKDRLLEYVADGGTLFIASPLSAKLFDFKLNNPDTSLIHISDGTSLAPLNVLCAEFSDDTENGETTGEYYLDNYQGNGPYPAAKIRKYGKGKIIALCFDLGNAYTQNRTTCIHNFFKKQINSLFPHPLVTIAGSDYAELVVTQKNGKIYINLLNYAGEHNVEGVRSFREIPTVGPITVNISNTIEPKEIYIQPEQKRWDGDLHKVVIEKLHVHTIIEVSL